jgi:hypothetical protein
VWSGHVIRRYKILRRPHAMDPLSLVRLSLPNDRVTVTIIVGGGLFGGKPKSYPMLIRLIGTGERAGAVDSVVMSRDGTIWRDP